MGCGDDAVEQAHVSGPVAGDELVDAAAKGVRFGEGIALAFDEDTIGLLFPLLQSRERPAGLADYEPDFVGCLVGENSLGIGELGDPGSIRLRPPENLWQDEQRARGAGAGQWYVFVPEVTVEVTGDKRVAGVEEGEPSSGLAVPIVDEVKEPAGQALAGMGRVGCDVMDTD